MEDLVIWKKESCLVGECERDSHQHWWSLPFTMAAGLMTTCYKCYKQRKVGAELADVIFQPNLLKVKWVEERLKELKNE